MYTCSVKSINHTILERKMLAYKNSMNIGHFYNYSNIYSDNLSRVYSLFIMHNSTFSVSYVFVFYDIVSVSC